MKRMKQSSAWLLFDRLILTTSISDHTYLLCSIAEYFYYLCHILMSPCVYRESQSTMRLTVWVKILNSAILHNKTSNKRFIFQHTKLLCPCGWISRWFYGAQIPCDIWTHFGDYLYSMKCNWIINITTCTLWILPSNYYLVVVFTI